MSEFARPTGIDWAGSHYGTVRYGEDNQKVVIFYLRSVENPSKSLETGTRIFENQVFIKIHEPGERLNIVDRPIKDEDKNRFPIQWNQFLQQKSQIPEGTPVDLLFPNNPAVADNLKGHGVHTVQQLSKLSANAIDSVGMGCQEWVNMADAYLRNASDGSAFLQLQNENSKLQRDIKIQKDQINQLIQQVNTLMAERNPDFNPYNPPFIKNHDVQAERINNLHITKELSKPQQRRRTKVSIEPPSSEVEQHEIARQVDAED